MTPKEFFDKWHPEVWDVIPSPTGVDEFMADLATVRAEVDAPEGCTVADAKVLREGNFALAAENQLLRQALRFYGNGDHWITEGQSQSEWDTCSGEPQNWWWRENPNDDAEGVEDGRIAAMALRGEAINWDGEEPKVVEGEPEWKIEQEVKRLDMKTAKVRNDRIDGLRSRIP